METIGKPSMKEEISRWMASPLRGRDLLLVTLTSWKRVEKHDLSQAIGKLIHRVKRRVLGRRFEGRDLACIVVLEKTYLQGVHAHLILENPYSLQPDKKFPCKLPIARLITDEWAKLGLGGKAVAQDVQEVYDLDGAIKYLQKTIGGASVLDRLDINNFCLP